MRGGSSPLTGTNHRLVAQQRSARATCERMWARIPPGLPTLARSTMVSARSLWHAPSPKGGRASCFIAVSPLSQVLRPLHRRLFSPGAPRRGRTAEGMPSLVLARQSASTLTTKNFLPGSGFSAGTAKAQLQTCGYPLGAANTCANSIPRKRVSCNTTV
jgi:hypothetical protein